jgi:hypothetical protein
MVTHAATKEIHMVAMAAGTITIVTLKCYITFTNGFLATEPLTIPDTELHTLQSPMCGIGKQLLLSDNSIATSFHSN